MLMKTQGHFALRLLLLVGVAWVSAGAQPPPSRPERETGTLEKMIVAGGNVTMDLDLSRLREIRSEAQESKRDSVRFDLSSNSFFKILVFNNAVRDLEPGSLQLIWGNSAIVPEPLKTSAGQLIIEKRPSNEPFELVLRDEKTAFVYFYVEGSLYDYDATAHLLRVHGRLLISEELAARLGRPMDAGAMVGEVAITATLSPIEVTKVVNGAVTSKILPPRGDAGPSVSAAVPGPDVIVGEVSSLQQFGSDGTQVGLGMGTDSCNNGDAELDFFAMPNTDHPVLPQNLYRMSGGAGNDERFEQVGQSWLPHAFFALQANACGFGCTPASDGTHLGVGCSNADSASINASQVNLGSRAWVNPFTGIFPSTANTHTGHTHTGTSHRLLVEQNDLNTTMNPGATYYAEAQFVTPQEYAWCQTHPGQCNMYNNASYRQFNVTGTTSFAFSPVGSTVRMAPAITAWPGATIRTIEPAPGTDGRAFLACKVTGPVAGIYHYEYAIYNQNLDRGIQSFSLNLLPPPIVNGAEIAAQNAGFHAPPQHPGFANDGTLGDAGYSDAPWTLNATVASLTWHSETFAQNPNANAIRWGTLYNFRFDSSAPPVASNAAVGFFKTGTPITVAILGVAPIGGTPTPTPIPTPGPATHFEVVAPTLCFINVPCSFTVRAQDQFNNTATGYAGTVHFTSTDGTAELPPAGMLTNGTGTLSAKFHTGGGQTITATDTSNASITGTSNTIQVVFVDPTPTPNPTATATATPTPAATATPTPGITLVDRLSDARASAATMFSGVDNPPPQIQTDFLPANLSNSAMVSGESGAASGNCTSNSSIIVDNSMGTLQVTGDGSSSASAILAGAFGSSTAKLIVISFTLTDRTYSYSLTGQLLANDFPGFVGGVATAKLTTGSKTIFAVVADAPPAVTLSQIGMLQPGEYTLSVDLSATAHGSNFGGHEDSRSSANCDFLLGPAPTPTPTATATPSQTPTPPPNPTIAPSPSPTPEPSFTPTPPTQALNVSTRLRVQTGDNAGFGGFIITGTESKHVLLRGIGPSLAASGITDALANPTLDLRDLDGVRILANDNWRDTQEAEIIATGIPPMDNLEAAIVQTLAPGSYTVILRGMGMTSGVGLVEIYNLNPGVSSKLANLSTRAFVDTGNNVVIAGFILGGSGDDRVVVRGIGPSLTAAGITNALPDPTLELRDSNGVLLRANNDWQTDPDQAAQLTAAGLAPTNSLESGVVATLSPGLYTALLAGANDGTGVGLVEAYDLGAP